MLSRGEAERFKAGWHAALGVLALGCLVYNGAAWWVRRERRLARNAVTYAALVEFERRQVRRHREARRRAHDER